MLNRIAVPNPTQMRKSDKYTVTSTPCVFCRKFRLRRIFAYLSYAIDHFLVVLLLIPPWWPRLASKLSWACALPSSAKPLADASRIPYVRSTLQQVRINRVSIEHQLGILIILITNNGIFMNIDCIFIWTGNPNNCLRLNRRPQVFFLTTCLFVKKVCFGALALGPGPISIMAAHMRTKGNR